MVLRRDEVDDEGERGESKETGERGKRGNERPRLSGRGMVQSGKGGSIGGISYWLPRRQRIS